MPSPPEQEEGQIPPQITLPPQQTHKSQSVDDSRSRCDADNTSTCFVPIDQTVFSDGLFFGGRSQRELSNDVHET